MEISSEQKLVTIKNFYKTHSFSIIRTYCNLHNYHRSPWDSSSYLEDISLDDFTKIQIDQMTSGNQCLLNFIYSFFILKENNKYVNCYADIAYKTSDDELENSDKIIGDLSLPIIYMGEIYFTGDRLLTKFSSIYY